MKSIEQQYEFTIRESDRRIHRMPKMPFGSSPYEKYAGFGMESATVERCISLHITESGYTQLKKDLEEYHNMTNWINMNLEMAHAYSKWEMIRILKS